MRYRVSVGDRTFSLEVGESAGQLRLSLDGQPVALDLYCADGRHLYTLLVDGRVHEIWVERNGRRYVVDVDGHSFDVTLQDERAARVLGGTAGRPLHEGELEVRAPMPGLVGLVSVQPGDAVERGRTLVVLEAMKMENDLSSPRDGVVKEVRVVPGQKVDQGQVLIVVGDAG